MVIYYVNSLRLNLRYQATVGQSQLFVHNFFEQTKWHKLDFDWPYRTTDPRGSVFEANTT